MKLIQALAYLTISLTAFAHGDHDHGPTKPNTEPGAEVLDVRVPIPKSPANGWQVVTAEAKIPADGEKQLCYYVASPYSFPEQTRRRFQSSGRLCRHHSP